MIENRPLSDIIGAGQLYQRVQLEKLTVEKIKGEAVRSWTVSETMMGHLEEMARDESLDSGAVTAYGMAWLVIRWFPTILTEDPNLETWRVSISEDVSDFQPGAAPVVTSYNIRHIEQLGRRRYLKLTLERWR